MADGIKTKCDFCDKLATVDGKTSMGPWAFMCDIHYEKYCTKVTGLYSLLAASTVQTKKCCRCNTEKPIIQFYKYTDHSGTERYRPECIDCNLAGRLKVKKEVSNE